MRTSKKILFATLSTLLFFLAVELILTIWGIEPFGYKMGREIPFSLKVRKPKDVYRIILVGESTAQGMPYYDCGGFFSWLQLMLKDVHPHRNIELFNAAQSGYCTWHVLKDLENILSFQPDLLVVYVGNNEFFGGPIRYRVLPATIFHINKLLNKSRLYSVMRRNYLNLVPEPGAGNSVPSAWPPNQEAEKWYRNNLAEIVATVRKSGTTLILCTVALNQKDYPPGKSFHRKNLTSEEHEKFTRLVEFAEQQDASGNLTAALEAYNQATKIDDYPAAVHFATADILFMLGRFQEAHARYWQAVDMDPVKVRAVSSFEDILRSFSDPPNVLVADCLQAMENQSPGYIIGQDLILDNCHPNLVGHQLIADTILNAMYQSQLIAPTDQWQMQNLRSQSEYRSLLAANEAQGYMTVGYFLADPGVKRYQLALNLFRTARSVPKTPFSAESHLAEAIIHLLLDDSEQAEIEIASCIESHHLQPEIDICCQAESIAETMKLPSFRKRLLFQLLADQQIKCR